MAIHVLSTSGMSTQEGVERPFLFSYELKHKNDILMVMSKPKKPFKLPEAFISQLKEFTNGFHLVIVNDEYDFDTYHWHPNKIVEMALLNYIDIQSTAVQEIIRQRTIESELPNEEDDNFSI